MDRIQQELLLALKNNGISFDIPPIGFAEKWEGILREKFGDHRIPKSMVLWDSLTGHISLSPGEGMKALATCMNTSEHDAILLIDDWGGHSAIQISQKDAHKLHAVIDKFYDFVWYISDQSLRFLLCKTDHDAFLLIDPSRVVKIL